MALIDTHGRRINYLRLSVTDRCNLRCTYCMPATGVPKVSCRDILSYEQMHDIARAAVGLGIEKIRVTGGEPLVRRGLPAFLERLARLSGLRQLVLTTNGVLLPEMAQTLKMCGVQRLNISLDSLRPEVFAAITRGGDLSRVVAGIAAAEKAGLPIKLNMVVMRGVNDAEVADFAALTIDRPLTVRFIEFMPAARTNDFRSLLVPGATILSALAHSFRLEPLDRGELCGPSQDFRIAGAAGTVGLITPVSDHFCGDCNRIRVTSEGIARSCLFGNEALDLRPVMATGNTDRLEGALLELVNRKPARHLINDAAGKPVPFAMAGIGG